MTKTTHFKDFIDIVNQSQKKGKTDFLIKFLRATYETLLSNKKQLSIYWENKDFDKISFLAHQLKGSALNLGVTELALLCDQIRQESLNKSLNKETLVLLMQYIDQLINLAMSMLTKIKSDNNMTKNEFKNHSTLSS